MTVKVKKVKPKDMRDELAVEAMRILMSEIRTNSPEGRKDVATTAYQLADEMMAAREGKP